jgi:alpha-beta hydrolase superfamily lysophospholipase
MAETGTSTRAFVDRDGVEIVYRRWLPDGEPKAIVQIAHGASEHSARYARFARNLISHGYAVFADDHRGHGLTAEVTGVGIAGPRGWAGLVDDLLELGDIARAEVGDRALVLIGHSMGSLLAQRFIQLYGDTLAGVVLSGSTGSFGELGAALSVLAELPPDEPAAIFGALNAPFEPARTPYDWLSRDPDEVDQYVADPMCGDDAPLTNGFVADMVRSTAAAWDPENECRVPMDLPVLFITGEADPVSQGGATVRELEARYKTNGVSDVTALYYTDARHELLNETNRDDVEQDVIDWLDRLLARR